MDGGTDRKSGVGQPEVGNGASKWGSGEQSSDGCPWAESHVEGGLWHDASLPPTWGTQELQLMDACISGAAAVTKNPHYGRTSVNFTIIVSVRPSCCFSSCLVLLL